MSAVRYPNGEYPESLFLCVGEGSNDEDGANPWKHLITAGTLEKWRSLQGVALRNTGVLLQITPGWNAYRPLWVQRVYRDKWGLGAAYPGQSSHGMNWRTNGRDIVCLALDIGNWGYAYGWDRERFFRDARSAGFTADLIKPPEFPDEPWHIIDTDPWRVVVKQTKTKDDEMTMSLIGVQGRDGSHSAGVFGIMRDNSGRLFAKRITSGTVPEGVPLIPADQLNAWRQTMPFHGL